MSEQTQDKIELKKFIENSRGDMLYDQLIGTLELQDLNKKLLTAFIDIDATCMAYDDPDLLTKFSKKFYEYYEIIPEIVNEIVRERIETYGDSEELKKVALYNLDSSTLHVELKVSHFPVVHDTLSTQILTVNDELQKCGHLTCVKKISIMKVYNTSFYLLSRKYIPKCDWYPDTPFLQTHYKNPLNILKNTGFFNQMPLGSNFHYKFINGNEEIKCDVCGEKYTFKKSDDVYTEWRIAEGVQINSKSDAKNLNSGEYKITFWFQAPFTDYIKEGQTVSVTGYYFIIPTFHYKKIGGRWVYPLKIGWAAFNFCPIIDEDIDIAIMDEIEGGISSLLTADLNLNQLLDKQTQQTSLMYKAKNYK